MHFVSLFVARSALLLFRNTSSVAADKRITSLSLLFLGTRNQKLGTTFFQHVILNSEERTWFRISCHSLRPHISVGDPELRSYVTFQDDGVFCPSLLPSLGESGNLFTARCKYIPDNSSSFPGWRFRNFIHHQKYIGYYYYLI